MSNLFWLKEVQMSRLQPFFPKSHGEPRVDVRRGRLIGRTNGGMNTKQHADVRSPEYYRLANSGVRCDIGVT